MDDDDVNFCARWFSSLYFFIYCRKGWTSFQLNVLYVKWFSMYNLSAYMRAINSSESSIRPCVPINNMYIQIYPWLIKHPGVPRCRFFVDHAHRRKKTPLLLIVYCAHWAAIAFCFFTSYAQTDAAKIKENAQKKPMVPCNVIGSLSYVSILMWHSLNKLSPYWINAPVSSMANTCTVYVVGAVFIGMTTSFSPSNAVDANGSTKNFAVSAVCLHCLLSLMLSLNFLHALSTIWSFV